LEATSVFKPGGELVISFTCRRILLPIRNGVWNLDVGRVQRGS